jgi:hypothetical protein
MNGFPTFNQFTKIKDDHALDHTYSSPYRMAAWLYGLEYWRDHSHPVRSCDHLGACSDHPRQATYLK